jgi:predicted HAD superfamily Cof-like phosphohydrolase
MKFPTVHVKANDYEYMGHLVSMFKKKGGEVRCVVEDEHGRLFIHNPSQLACADGPGMESMIFFDPVADMIEFHEKLGLDYNGRPRAITGELLEFRSNFHYEEADEYKEHAEAAADEITKPVSIRDQANYAYHLDHALDSLVDLVYVAIGAAYLHGFNFKEAWRRVHEANMKKVRAERKDQSKRGSTFDVVKPEGWTPPSHIDLVEVNDVLDPHEELA